MEEREPCEEEVGVEGAAAEPGVDAEAVADDATEVTGAPAATVSTPNTPFHPLLIFAAFAATMRSMHCSTSSRISRFGLCDMMNSKGLSGQKEKGATQRERVGERRVE